MKNNTSKIISFLKSLFFSTILPAAVITSVVLAAVCPISCRVTEESLSLLEGDFTVPKIISCDVLDEHTVCVTFSKQVSVPSATIIREPSQESLPQELSVESQDFQEKQEGNAQVYFVMNDEMEVGKSYQLDGCVKDRNGNALSFSLGFAGFNARVPRLILNEVRNAYGRSKVSDNFHRKTEFVELLALSDGNLFGVQIESANDGVKTRYTFPAVEVKKGDYVTVHMRQIPQQDLIPGEVMADELSSDLTLSVSLDSCSSARDLWSPNTGAVFAPSDIIIVRSSPTGPVQDALHFSLPDKDLETLYPDFYALTVENGIWEGPALDSTNVTSSAISRTMSRQNSSTLLRQYSDGDFISTEGAISNSASQWIVTAEKTVNKIKYPGATPGYANSVNSYSK